MKKIFNLLTLAAVFGVATSCTDILDTAPNDKLSSGTMWTTEALTRALLACITPCRDLSMEIKLLVPMP